MDFFSGFFVHFLLLNQNTCDWVIYKEEKVILFTVLKIGEFNIREVHLLRPRAAPHMMEK
jgi:hypothetical protein